MLRDTLCLARARAVRSPSVATRSAARCQAPTRRDTCDLAHRGTLSAAVAIVQTRRNPRAADQSAKPPRRWFATWDTV
jgi:hypothetical protein